jgi:hypothetical protein
MSEDAYNEDAPLISQAEAVRQAWRRGREEGAAVAFGLMGMAEAIRENGNVSACPICLKAGPRTFWTGSQWVHSHPCGANLGPVAALQRNQG